MDRDEHGAPEGCREGADGKRGPPSSREELAASSASWKPRLRAGEDAADARPGVSADVEVPFF